MWGAIASALAPSLIGGLFGSGADGGAGQAAAVSREDALKASEMAKFKPYAITSGFGKSMFDTENNTASYELDPTLKAFQDQLYGLGQQGMAGLNVDPTQIGQDYYNQQQNIMAGGRGAEDIALRQQQLQSGRIGLGLSGASQGAGANTGFVNPDQYGMQLARAQQDQQLAGRAASYGREQVDSDIKRATGLFDQGFGVEKLGQSAMTMGADLGNMAAQAGASQGKLFLGGANNATDIGLAGNTAENEFYTGLGKGLGGMKGLGGSLGGMFSTPMGGATAGKFIPGIRGGYTGAAY